MTRPLDRSMYAVGIAALLALPLAAQTRITERPPGRPTVKVVNPGPAPQNVRITGSPLITYLSWTVPLVRGTVFSVQRSLEADPACCNTRVDGLVVPSWTDPGLHWPGTFLYRIIATYPDGSVGSTEQRWTRPDPVNPGHFTASLAAPHTVRLQWEAVPGASWYELSGPGVPTPSFQATYTYFNVQNLPSGTHVWRVGTVLSSQTAGPASGPRQLFPQAAAVVP